MDWLLVLALNFTDGGYQLLHTPVPSKAACELVLRTSLEAKALAATAPFKWRATCIDLKEAKVDHPELDVESSPPASCPVPLGEPGTEQRS